MMDDRELLVEFVEESEQHLQDVEPDLLELEDMGDDVEGEVVNRIFRAVHSMKGASGFFGLKNIGQVSHEMESLLSLLRDKEIGVTSGLIDCLLAGIDKLWKMLKDVEGSDEMEIADVVKMIIDLRTGKTSTTTEAEPEKTDEPDLDDEAEDESLPFSEFTITNSELRKISETGKYLFHVNMDSKADFFESDDTKKTKPAKSKSGKKSPKLQIQTEEKLRINISQLNDLVDIARELVLGRNQLMQTMHHLVKDTPGLSPVLNHISWVTSEMQERIMQLRMQSVGALFGKFPRIVRDISRANGKEINLISDGEDVELDKTIIELLIDPLTHLVRNSVDHAIEKPGEREKIGKSRQGIIRIHAYHESGWVHINIGDDGRGIDVDKVVNKAIETGQITAAEAETMSEKDKLRIIFKAGLSTADKVTSVSGRGVGIDVVRSNIEQLGGTVEIESEIGVGTTIKLVLPLTLAIVNGLVTRSKGQRFIVPDANLQELVRIKPDDFKERIQFIQDRRVLRLRDDLLPLLNLNEVLGLQSMEVKDQDPESDSPSENGKVPMRILVLRSGLAKFAVQVDSVDSIEEIVVKPLPRYLQRMRCFSGTTIMGDGTVAFILDTAGIASLTGVDNFEEQVAAKSDGSDSKEAAEQLALLLFDIGTHEQFAIPLELIQRLERTPYEDIEWIEDRPFLRYRGENLRLVFLEDYLPISRPERTNTDLVGIMVPKLLQRPMGIVINKVIDTIETEIELDTKSIIAPGLFGTAVLNEKITLMPDIFKLFEMADPEFEKGQNHLRKSKERKKRILVVDDTPFFRLIEKDYLESAGFEVETASDGEQALMILAAREFDGVILDIIMPNMDGWETIKSIRSDDRWKNLPVLAVTSIGDEESARRGIEAGFNDWEIKVNKERMLEKLNNIL